MVTLQAAERTVSHPIILANANTSWQGRRYLPILEAGFAARLQL